MVERDRVVIGGCLGWRMRPCLVTWEGVELREMVVDWGGEVRSRGMKYPLLQLPLLRLESLGGRCKEKNRIGWNHQGWARTQSRCAG